MGLKGNLKAWVLHALAPRARKREPLVLPRAVRLADGLNGMYHLRGPNFDYTFTGDQAFQEFLKPILRGLNSSEDIYVCLVDDQRGVPWQKHAEQDSRRQQKASAPEGPASVVYDEGCVIEPQGLRLPGAAADDPHQRFVLDAVIKNAKLRKQLMEYFRKCLCEVAIPQGKTLRFEYDYDGPWIFDSNGCMQAKELRSAHGEYDVTAMRIAACYPERPIIFQTTDTDTIPLVTELLHLQNTTFTQPVVWVCDTDGYIDCKEMVEGCLSNLGLTANQFILGCVLCGTDYTPKGALSTGLNDGAIMGVLKANPALCAELSAPERDHADYSALRRYVRRLHTSRLDGGLKERLKKDRAAKTVENRDNKKRKAAVGEAEGAPDNKKRKLAEAGEPAKAELVATDMHRTFHHVADCMVGRDSDAPPLSWDACLAAAGKKFRLPEDKDLKEVSHRIAFNLWFWTQQWTLPGVPPTYEAWKQAQQQQ